MNAPERLTWRRRLLGYLQVVGIAYVGVVLVLWLLENRLVYHPVGPTEEWIAPPCPEIEDVTLQCADGTRIHGWWLPREGAKSAMLYFHGNAGNLSWRGSSIAKMRDRLGVSVLIIDYPGYGRSEGHPSEAGCYQSADAAYAWLTEYKHFAPRQILLYGGSLGGGVAVDLASRKDHRAMILVKTFSSLPDVASYSYPWIPVHWIMRNRYPSVEKIAKCNRPVFITHGTTDELIPLTLGKKLYEAAREPKQFHVMPGCGHNDPLTDDVFDELQAFLDKHAPLD